MKVGYCEYMGNNWTAHFRIKESETGIEIKGDTPEEMLNGILSAMKGTSNNVEICLFPYYIRSGERLTYWEDNGFHSEDEVAESVILDYLSTIIAQ